MPPRPSSRSSTYRSRSASMKGESPVATSARRGGPPNLVSPGLNCQQRVSCIFQSTTTEGRATPQMGRLHGHEIEAYFEEAEQCCPEGSGHAQAPSRRPEGCNDPKPSIGCQEVGEHPPAELRCQDGQGRGQESQDGRREG